MVYGVEYRGLGGLETQIPDCGAYDIIGLYPLFIDSVAADGRIARTATVSIGTIPAIIDAGLII